MREGFKGYIYQFSFLNSLKTFQCMFIDGFW